jgi:ADP-ribose pyrophosphatase YjhB (NUDIX family)
MKPFLFCPACGARLPSTRDREGEATCTNCGRSWYLNAAPTAAAAIVSNGRALVTIRAGEPFAGKFDVSGGFLHHDEDPLIGVKREVAEELGVEIDVGYEDFLQAIPHTYGEDGDWVLALGFKARLISGVPRPADDVKDVRWVTAEEIEELDFAWEHDRELVRKALAHERD